MHARGISLVPVEKADTRLGYVSLTETHTPGMVEKSMLSFHCVFGRCLRLGRFEADTRK